MDFFYHSILFHHLIKKQFIQTLTKSSDFFVKFERYLKNHATTAIAQSPLAAMQNLMHNGLPNSIWIV